MNSSLFSLVWKDQQYSSKNPSQPCRSCRCHHAGCGWIRERNECHQYLHDRWWRLDDTTRRSLFARNYTTNSFGVGCGTEYPHGSSKNLIGRVPCRRWSLYDGHHGRIDTGDMDWWPCDWYRWTWRNHKETARNLSYTTRTTRMGHGDSSL